MTLQARDDQAYIERATFNLLAALVMGGCESMGIDAGDAMDLTNLLVADDPMKANKISGFIVRGQEVPMELAVWARDVRRASEKAPT